MKNAAKNKSARVSAICLLVFGLCAPAWAATYSTKYEMSVDPSTGAGVLDATSSDANGNGLLTVGSGGSGSTFSGGIMHFIDNTPSGNLGYYFNQASATDIAYTIDIAVKANNNVNG